MSWYGWKPYVSVGERKAKAAAFAVKLAKKEKRSLTPIKLAKRTIASSFWGKAWCDHLESFSDFESRLPRGRTYVRNGSVIDLDIKRGRVKAIVSGSEIYRITIDIDTVCAARWSKLRKNCAHSIDSLFDLLQGRFDQGIMERLTCPETGLFPDPDEIHMKCSCPDWAVMCKHVAATLYGVGSRLDVAPELLFTLRAVDHLDLIKQAVDAGNLDQALKGDAPSALAESDLGEIFGIELDAGQKGPPAKATAGFSPKNAERIAAKPRATKKPVGKANKMAAKKPKSKTRPVKKVTRT